MPLQLVASNLTKGKPTFFKGDVSIIDALRCSCCLPVVYRPQELYGDIYIDGDAYLPYFGMVIEDGLVISLKRKYQKIKSEDLKNINLLSYIRQVYNTGIKTAIQLNKTKLTLELEYPNLSAESDLNNFDMNDVVKVSEELMRRFLISNGFLQEISKVGDTGST